MAITLDINSSRRISTAHPQDTRIMGRKSGIFKPWRRRLKAPGAGVPFAAMATTMRRQRQRARNRRSCNNSHQRPNLASRKQSACLAKYLRHGCMDLNLSIEGFDCNPPGDADWQPGAILRMPFSERLCRNGGTVSARR